MKPYKIPQVKLTYVSDNTEVYEPVKQSYQIAQIFRDKWEEGELEYRESIKVAYLNRQNRVLGVMTVSSGGTASSVFDLKLVLTGALLANSSSIILCHNHPSGSMRPSPEDDKITQTLKEGAKMVGLKLLDHIILTKDNFYSYQDNLRL